MYLLEAIAHLMEVKLGKGGGGGKSAGATATAPSAAFTCALDTSL